MIFKLFIFSVLASSAFCLDIIPCGDDWPPPLELVVNNCPDNPPCPLYKGDSGRANITFVVPVDADTMTLEVNATVFGANIKYPMPDPEVCHFLGNAYCPLEAGEHVTYNLDVPVAKFYPKIELKLWLFFYGPNREKAACFQLPCQVKDKPTI